MRAKYFILNELNNIKHFKHTSNKKITKWSEHRDSFEQKKRSKQFYFIFSNDIIILTLVSFIHSNFYIITQDNNETGL